MVTARREASESSRGDGSPQLHTLVNVVMGGVDGKNRLAALPSLSALLEQDDMSMDEFHHDLKADDRYKVVVF